MERAEAAGGLIARVARRPPSGFPSAAASFISSFMSPLADAYHAKTLEMLVQEQNKKGGFLGRNIELVVKDSGASPEKAFSFAKQLIEDPMVRKAYLGEN